MLGDPFIIRHRDKASHSDAISMKTHFSQIRSEYHQLCLCSYPVLSVTEFRNDFGNTSDKIRDPSPKREVDHRVLDRDVSVSIIYLHPDYFMFVRPRLHVPMKELWDFVAFTVAIP